MNLRNLHTFVIVADAGGFARASGRLNLTQPAASRQILALEQELGVALFDRIGRRIQLTSEGEDLLRRSRRVLEDVASLGERARALKAGHVGTLRVGAPTQVIENFLAPFVMQYQRRHPGIEVHLQEAAAARLQTHLDRGDVHLGIMPSGLDPFQGQVLYPIYVTAALARSHQWAHRRVLEIKQLSDNPLLLLGREFGLRAWSIFGALRRTVHGRARSFCKTQLSGPDRDTARATSATATAARIEIEVRLGSKLGHGDDVRCMTALPPKAEVKGDLAMSPKCHNRS